MPEPARESVEMRDFPGLINTIDRRDLPPGASPDQTNMACIVQGEMSVRLGYREVAFDATGG